MILDVGCGRKPQGNVNVDLKINRDASNFIKADAYHLPFRTDIFKLLIASHVLEHLLTPTEALNEWQRVARTVVIKVPSASVVDFTKDHYYTWNPITLNNLLLTKFGTVQLNHHGFTSKTQNGILGKIVNFILRQLPYEIVAVCT